MNILNRIKDKAGKGKKSLAVLIDPDKLQRAVEFRKMLFSASEQQVDYFLVGGSLISKGNLRKVVQAVKEYSNIPVVLFPGSYHQIDGQADALLFLSLISGRNPEYLIGQHVVAAPMLKESGIEVIPTGYLLVGAENQSSVAYISNTSPIPREKTDLATCTAIAGQMLGMQLIYLEAGSGASHPVPPEMISMVKDQLNIPLIVGGGINTVEKAYRALESGADMIVIGNAIERSPTFLNELAAGVAQYNASLNVHE